VGLASLAVVAIVFGLHSAIDWTWFVPGNVLPALLCAGWVASRATLRERVEGLQQPNRVLPRQVLVGAAAVVALLGLVSAWSAVQPVRADHAQAASLNRLDQGALPAAESIARIAHDRNPLSVDPLFDLAAIQQAAGQNDKAKVTLNQAIDLEPANPETWRQLGAFQLAVNDPAAALRSYQIAYFLDPRSKQSTTDIVVASRLAAARQGG
jgi:tetratricopeptide (TPR) repeat protein